jgi:hypothetical protein
LSHNRKYNFKYMNVCQITGGLQLALNDNNRSMRLAFIYQFDDRQISYMQAIADFCIIAITRMLWKPMKSQGFGV